MTKATADHRGYRIQVCREQSLAGEMLLYFSVMRIDDGWFCVDSFTDSDESITELLGHLINRIDAEMAQDDPWDEQTKIDQYE